MPLSYTANRRKEGDVGVRRTTYHQCAPLTTLKRTSFPLIRSEKTSRGSQVTRVSGLVVLAELGKERIDVAASSAGFAIPLPGPCVYVEMPFPAAKDAVTNPLTLVT